MSAHPPKHYVKIWAILLVLLVISVLGPMVGIQWLTLVTAFGIALVKAYLVTKHFMHLGIEKRYIVYLLSTAIVIMLIFFAGTAADVMKHDGQQWTNQAAKDEILRAQTAAAGSETAHH